MSLKLKVLVAKDYFKTPLVFSFSWFLFSLESLDHIYLCGFPKEIEQTGKNDALKTKWSDIL